jgi:hypothetical protein
VLRDDSLSFDERRRVSPGKRPKFGESASLMSSSVRTSRSVMEELARSPFASSSAEGPLQAIRRNMLKKKRAARTLPSLRRRASVQTQLPGSGLTTLERARAKVRSAAKAYDK